MIIKPKYITDVDGNRLSVIISIPEFDYLIERYDDFEDVRLYDKAKKRTQVFRDAKEVFEEIEKHK